MKYLFCLIAIFTSAVLFSQNTFEGTIKYKYSYQSLYDWITTEYIEKNFPSEEIKTYKDSLICIQTIFANSTDTVKTIYNLSSQKGYIVYPDKDAIREIGINSIPGALQSNGATSLVKEVLGRSCKSFELQYTADIYKGRKMTCLYYYTDDYLLDIALYENFKSDYMHLYAASAKSIYLASSISIEKLYRIDGIATEIIEKEIPANFFELPEGKEVVPMK